MKRNDNGAIDFSALTVEDIAANPGKFGVPTFEQFCKNPGRYRRSKTIAMDQLSAGPQHFRRDLNSIIYKVHGEEMPEDHVERALGNHGFTLSDIDLLNQESLLKKEVNMIPLGGGKYDIVVNFLP